MVAAAAGEIDTKSFARNWDELTLSQKAEQVRIYSQLPKSVRDVYCKYVYRPIDGKGDANWYNQSEIDELTANALARFQICTQSFFYHGVTRERLEALVAAGQIDLSEVGGHTAAFVTTTPLREMGDYFLALGRQHVERDYHLECGFQIPRQPVYVAGLFPEITLDDSTLLYVISVTETLTGRRTLARKLRLLTGRDIPVIHFCDAIKVINRVARLSMGIPVEWHNQQSQAKAVIRSLTGSTLCFSSSDDSEFIMPAPQSSATSSSSSSDGQTTATEGSSSYYTTSKSSSDEDRGTTSSSGSYECYSTSGSGSDDESGSTSSDTFHSSSSSFSGASYSTSTSGSYYTTSSSSSDDDSGYVDYSSSGNSSYYSTSKSSSGDESGYDTSSSSSEHALPPPGLSARPSPREFQRVWADSSLTTRGEIVRYFGDSPTYQVLRAAVASTVYRDISPLTPPIWLSQSELNHACSNVAGHKRICLEGFYFHATTLELLESSIRQGRIEPRDDELYSGVTLSTIPLTKAGDDVIIALRRSVEWSSEVSRGLVRYDQSFNYVGVFTRSIPLNKGTLAYIIVADEALMNPTLLERRLRGQTGFEVSVFTKAVVMPVIIEMAQLGLGVPAEWPANDETSVGQVAGLTNSLTALDGSSSSTLTSPDWSVSSGGTQQTESGSEEASGSLSYPGCSSQSDMSEEASA